MEIGEGLVPALELAAGLERHAEGLLRSGTRFGIPEIARRCVHLATGLTHAAEALRLANRGERADAARRLESAVRMLVKIVDEETVTVERSTFE
ncbi:hypothetical protein [Amycolatopsis sp. lyj-23]|uniref:hypothetical protein n=1 Tax=Amycolatopsis sp. lyj-23 TaxID=2789283 RepID=UPI00397E49B7